MLQEEISDLSKVINTNQDKRDFHEDIIGTDRGHIIEELKPKFRNPNKRLILKEQEMTKAENSIKGSRITSAETFN